MIASDTVGIITGAIGVFCAGWGASIFRNGYVKKTNCRSLHKELGSEMLFIQYLLMEITTEEQQNKARKKLENFRTQS